MGLGASRCGACEAVFVPPRGRCTACGAGTEEHEVPGRGVLRSWTVVRRAPEGFEAPYVAGVVELEGGVLAVARGPGSEEDVPPLDAEVRVVEAEGMLRFEAI